MTMMLLALVFSNAALNSADASDRPETAGPAEPRTNPTIRARAWRPGIDSWEEERRECPIFFQDAIEGFGVVRIGPRCDEPEIPYAL